MATIIQRNGKFLARVRKTGFPFVSQSFTRKTDATAWARKVEADMQAGRWVAATAPTPSLTAAIAEYRLKVAVNLKGARDYAYSFKEIESSALGSQPVNQVKASDLADWRDELTNRGLKPATVARRLGLLSAVLSWCQKEKGWLSDNPMRSVRKPIIRNQCTRTLDPEEVRYLGIATAAARAVWLSDAITVLIGSAMRRSELVNLRCCDVDMARSVAKLQDAKAGARDVPLCAEARAALQRLIAVAEGQSRASVLPIQDPEALSFAFKRAVDRGRARYEEDCAASGLPCAPTFLKGIRLHDLRHHSITQWAKTGSLSLFELMKISGHASPKMLARYTHVRSDDVAAKLSALSTPAQMAMIPG